MLGLFVSLLVGAIAFGTFLLTLVLPFALIGAHSSKVRAGFQRMQKERGWVAGIREVLEGAERMEWRSELLKREQGRLRGANGVRSSQALKRLDRILDLYEARSNPFVGIVLNVLILWDLQCYELLRSWERHYGEDLLEWVDAVAELDSLSSLASVASDHPSFSYPDFNGKKGKVLEGSALGHPLIPDEERVDNDLEIPSTGHIKIVTGANMAGKSTFLRTVGVNWILAKAGTAVCAERMAFRPIALFSSMRTSDDLAENESFFYAELKRLRMIVDELEQGKELMILLDEILQGTNSEDKKRGSRRFLERILQYPVAGLIATHDLDLTRMEDDPQGRIENLCFEAELEGGRSTFDHLLRKGVCRNMNASALMERMGIG
jgi:DNA mismatch repair ATPase MutS